MRFIMKEEQMNPVMQSETWTLQQKCRGHF